MKSSYRPHCKIVIHIMTFRPPPYHHSNCWECADDETAWHNLVTGETSAFNPYNVNVDNMTERWTRGEESEDGIYYINRETGEKVILPPPSAPDVAKAGIYPNTCPYVVALPSAPSKCVVMDNRSLHYLHHTFVFLPISF